MPKGDDKKLVADIDDGYSKVAFLISEALSCAPLSGAEHNIIHFIMRRTYGWAQDKNRKSGKRDVITAAEIALGTRKNKQTVSNCLSALTRLKIIIATKITNDNYMAYGINSNVYEWGAGDEKWDEIKRDLLAHKDAGLYWKFDDPITQFIPDPITQFIGEGITQFIPDPITQFIGDPPPVSPCATRPDEVPTEMLTETLTDITTNNIESTVVDSPRNVETADVAMVEKEVELELKPTPAKPAKKQRAKTKPKEHVEPKEETPAQQAIRYAYETLLNAPLKTGKGYSGLTELISTHGVPVVYEWVAAIGSISVPEGADVWKHFCVRFREIARRWEWENKTKNFNQPQPTKPTQADIDYIQNVKLDDYSRPI